MRFLVPLFALMATPALANLPDCEGLAAVAGQEAGLPETLLPAVARMESGYAIDGVDRRAWPWTLNQGGRSMYFDTRAEALAYLEQAVAEGVTNIDVGCMQINYRWHHDNFPSLADMLDPDLNTRYGAQFMAELYNQLGGWDAATASYHSRNTDRGGAYRERVYQIIAEIRQEDPVPLPEPQRGFLTRSPMPLVAMAPTVEVYLASEDDSQDDAPQSGAPEHAPRPRSRGTYDEAAPVAVVLSASTEEPRTEGRWRVTDNRVLASRESLPLRLQRDWDKIEAFRELFGSAQ